METQEKNHKRFNNGHKTFTYQEQQFLKETYIRERSSFEKFTEKAPTMRRPRDPTNGEITPRKGFITTDLWMPHYEQTSRLPDKFIETQSSIPPDEYDVNRDMAGALRARKDKINRELETLNAIVARKQEKLSTYSITSSSPSSRSANLY
jgi:hypothetical protein